MNAYAGHPTWSHQWPSFGRNGKGFSRTPWTWLIFLIKVLPALTSECGRNHDEEDFTLMVYPAPLRILLQSGHRRIMYNCGLEEFLIHGQECSESVDVRGCGGGARYYSALKIWLNWLGLERGAPPPPSLDWPMTDDRWLISFLSREMEDRLHCSRVKLRFPQGINTLVEIKRYMQSGHSEHQRQLDDTLFSLIGLNPYRATRWLGRQSRDFI